MTQKHIRRVLVACGARRGANPLYAQEARKLGKLLYTSGYQLVYGGSDAGLMGEVAAGVLGVEGGRLRSIYPKIFSEKAIGYPTGVPPIETDDLFERKKHMILETQGTIVLPGGIGTLDELTEIAAANDVRRLEHPELPLQPIIIMNVDGFYDGLLTQFQRCVKDGFISKETMDMFHVTANAEETVCLLHRLNADQPRPARTLCPVMA
jgi:uncharacterized protein (TIGR00730 family)